MAKLGDAYNMFDDTTLPRSDAADSEQKPVEVSANGSQAQRPAKPAKPRTKPETPAEMGKHEKARWRTNLQNGARKVARDRARLTETEQAWEDLVADARAAGVPPLAIVAAAADAEIELPK